MLNERVHGPDAIPYVCIIPAKLLFNKFFTIP